MDNVEYLLRIHQIIGEVRGLEEAVEAKSHSPQQKWIGNWASAAQEMHIAVEHLLGAASNLKNVLIANRMAGKS